MTQHTILVVEDNPITRKMMRFALESEGYVVLEAGDGQTALALAAKQRPDLVLQDYVLPDMDGLQLIKSLRALPERSDVPVLVITGMVSQLEELRGQGDELTSFLPKPIEPSRLVEIVATHLISGSQEIGRGHRVLVVDDEALGRKLAALHLRDAGFTVETAPSGFEALIVARASPPDAILSDILMPGMDGFALCDAVRRDERLFGIPVVLLSSAYAEEADERLAREMGADALVVRTPDLRDAIQMLVRALNEGRAAQPQAMAAPDELETLHRERVQIQLERQIQRNDALTRQGAIQSAALSVVRGLAAALAEPTNLPKILGDVLVHCLDAAGLSTGLLYLAGRDGRLELQAQAGLPAAARDAAAACFGRPEVLRGVLDSGQPTAYVSGATGQEAGPRELVEGLAKAFALAIPFVVGEERVGVLVLAADSQDLSEPAWVGFAEALAVQFGQTIAVGQSLSRGAASEARYTSLMEHASDAIMIVDSAGVVLEVNRQADVLLGRSRIEIVGCRYDEFVMPDEREESRPSKEQPLPARTLRTQDRTLLRSDGSQVSVEVSASVLGSGAEAIILLILRDITERKRSEAELHAAQQRLEHVVSSSPAVLYTLRVDGDRLAPAWTSSNIQDFIGYKPIEVGDADWWLEQVHPDDREGVLAQARGLLASGQVEREYRFRRKDGSYAWIRDKQRLLRDAAGKPVEVIGSWWDISDRKLTELRLAESEEQYRLLFAKHPQPLWVYDLETLAFLDVNDAAVRHYGYSREEFLAMTIKDIRPPEEVPALLEFVKRKDHVGTRGIWKHRTKAGKTILLEIVSSAILFQGRDAEVVLANDITEKTTLEAQLLQSQKMEAIGQLAGGVAHDFNNLLGVISGYATLLQKDLDPLHPGVKRLGHIRRAAERAAELTRQLLAFSRKQVLEPKVLDLNAVVTGVDPMLRRLIGEDVQLVTSLGKELGQVKADPGQLEQVIMNLAVNARDAMPQGGSLILETANVDLDEAYVRNHPDLASGSYVVLAASDTGHGMDAATIAHIFEPFFTTKPEGKGTGLGLSTVFGIVKQSGGHVAVYSEVGQGTSFKVYLPRIMGETEPVELPASLPAMPTASETILLVEDADALRQMIGEILGESGYKVIPASNPEEALNLAALHEGPIEAVLTDVVMPGMSGRQLTDRLRVVRPATRVIYMSGYTDEAIGHHGALEPGTHFLQKPFTAVALLQKLRTVLGEPP